MNQSEVSELFKKNNALLSGHFLLSSGLHSDVYFQSALILQYPKEAEKLAEELGGNLIKNSIKADVVISPAIGGIILGQEIARFLGVRAIFTEKVDGKSVLRRGFHIKENERVVIAEDVITTGLSTNEVINTIKPFGAEIVAILSLVDRSAGKINFNVPKFSLLNLEVKNYKPQDCPMCKQGDIPIKPGSRK
ncbi:MAG: orotate phosphoribosyltransferase [Elusimicrobiota bacterium]|jgi:orotate phosphoribosyltransferase|nr:orotate phosphoribosyltransferase [Elusimicrobiota bacterium]